MNEREKQRRKAEYLKKVYPPGTRIVLNSMGDETDRKRHARDGKSRRRYWHGALRIR